MKKYSFNVTFCDGRVEKVSAFTFDEAAILACAVRIHSGKNIKLDSIACSEKGIRIAGKQLILK